MKIINRFPNFTAVGILASVTVTGCSDKDVDSNNESIGSLTSHNETIKANNFNILPVLSKVPTREYSLLDYTNEERELLKAYG